MLKKLSFMSLVTLLSLVSFSSFAGSVNVNTASVEDIASSLSGIGPSKAQAIYDYCRANKCKKAEDLLAIKGIGEKTLEKIKGDLIFSAKK